MRVGWRIFSESLGLNLTNALASDFELLADLFEGAGIAVTETEAQGEDALLAFRQAGHDFAQSIFEQAEARQVERALRGLVLDEIANVGLVPVAHRRLQRDGLLGHFQDGPHALDGKLHFVGKLLGGGFAAEVLDQLFLDAHQFVDRFDHVHRDADGARLIGDRARDGLPDPPGGVGGELVAALILEFLDGLHQPHVAFLDQIEEGEPAVGVAFGDGDHEPKIGFDHFRFGVVGLLGAFEEFVVGVHELLAGHADEFLQRVKFGEFAAEHVSLFFVGPRFFQFLDYVEGFFEAIVDVLGDVPMSSITFCLYPNFS